MTQAPADDSNRPSPPTVAGRFYPAEPAALEEALACAVAAAQPAYERPWTALVVPHAGYRYSGMVAASAYRSLGVIADRIRRVVLLAPAHRLAFEGLAVTATAGFATPIGDVAIDRAAVAEALGLAGVRLLPEAFHQEHGIETQLPFIRRFLPQAAILPVVVGNARRAELAAVMERFAGAPDTLTIVSCDLSHYHSLAEAQQLDDATCLLVEQFRADRLAAGNACGWRSLAALLDLARRRGWRITRLDQKTSADSTGDVERVVGYAAWGFEAADAARLPDGERCKLLNLSREALAHAADGQGVRGAKFSGAEFPLRTGRQTFVTLAKSGALRGCIGSLRVRRSLADDVILNTVAAALNDRRFSPLRPDELPRIDIEIAILSGERPLSCADEGELVETLRPHRDGLVISGGGHSALFLPKVWRDCPDPRQFVGQLKRKAGLAPADWPADMRCAVFTAEAFASRVG